MFGHKNKKELEYKKTRSAYRKEEGFRILKVFYRTFYYFLVISFIIITVYSLFFSQFLTISDFETRGIDKLDAQAVRSAIKSGYDGKYLGLFPKNNLILFPEERIKKDLLKNFKRIKEIDIEKKFPNLVLITIKERESLILWCSPQEECFIMDEGGVAYGKTTLDSKEVLENDLLKIKSGEDGRIIWEGEKILDSETVKFLFESKNDFYGRSKIKTNGEIFMKSRMAEEISLKSEEGWDILLNIKIPLVKSAETLKISLERELPNADARKNLERVDLRVENRAYYKFKGEEKEEVTEEDQSQK